jgi:uncharacterized membrane protein (DUF441 family)|tara:strand:- start:299 stop:499 length:201 start_codon:yes stop_codon:yes gene_type:complete
MVSIWKQLFSSKKFTAMVIGIAATFLADKYGLDQEQTTLILGTIISYIIGQGIADNGKEAAKVEAS